MQRHALAHLAEEADGARVSLAQALVQEMVLDLSLVHEHQLLGIEVVREPCLGN